MIEAGALTFLSGGEMKITGKKEVLFHYFKISEGRESHLFFNIKGLCSKSIRKRKLIGFIFKNKEKDQAFC